MRQLKSIFWVTATVLVTGVLVAADEARAPRPPVDTGSESSTGPVGETFSTTVTTSGCTLPNDVNVTHNLTVGGDLTVVGMTYPEGGIDHSAATTLDIGRGTATAIDVGNTNSTTTFFGLVSASAARLLLPVAPLAPVTGLVEGSVTDIAGILSMYDDARAAWLSVNRPQVWFARAGSVTNGYLNIVDGVSSRSTGYLVARDASLTGMSISSGGNVWYVASVGGDFPDLQTAIASPSVVNGDVIKMAPETFTTLTQITINKSVTIEGCGAGPVIQMPDTASSYILLAVTANNVIIRNLSLIQQKPKDDSDASAAISVASAVTGFHADGLSVTTTVWGIVMHNAQGVIENCNFHYQGPANKKHRFIGFYGNTGNTFVRNNTFYPSSDTPVAKSVFCYLTSAVPSDAYAGQIIFENNVQEGSGNLLQFFIQDSFPGPAGGFGLYIADNTYNDLGGGIIFYGAADILNLFSSVVITQNSVSNAGGKGLVGFDGWSTGVLPGTTTWYIDGNTIANPTISAPGWASACATPGIAGYNTDAFQAFTITFSSVIPTPPAPPALFAIEVRKNGCPGAILTATLYASNGWTTGLNVPVSQGDRLQTYVAGTAINPTVGLEYAYRA